MKMAYYILFRFSFVFCLFFVISESHASDTDLINDDVPACERKEASLTFFQLAKESIKKAKESVMKGKDIQGNDVAAEGPCGSVKYKSYLDVATTLINDGMNMVDRSFLSNSSPSRLAKTMDCSEVMESGQNSSGVYYIWLRNRVVGLKPLKVYCDMETDGGGWLVIQRRGNFSKQQDFYLDWEKYKNGFGNLNEEFWIGNDNLFALSNQDEYRIRFDLWDVEGNKAFAVYDTFFIDDDLDNYQLHIQGYSGTAGDSMVEHHLQYFSTRDKKNDKAPGEPCTTLRHGAWWYLNCAKANLNGLYQPGKKNDHKSVYWYAWKGLDGLAAVEIKIKKKEVRL